MRRNAERSELKRTLEELEGEKWGESPFASHLITTCHRLRRVPIEELGIEDLRILLGQAIGWYTLYRWHWRFWTPTSCPRGTSILATYCVQF
jgi:hypothetical protein